MMEYYGPMMGMGFIFMLIFLGLVCLVARLLWNGGNALKRYSELPKK